MEEKKAHSPKEVLLVTHYKHKSGELKSIAKNQTRLAEVIASLSSYSSARTVQAMLSQTIGDSGFSNWRPMPTRMRETIVGYAMSVLTEEDFLCFKEDFNQAIKAARNEHSLKKTSNGGHDHVLFDEEFASATKNLLRHIELLDDNSSSFESVESKLSFRYKGVDIDIHLKRSAPEKSD